MRTCCREGVAAAVEVGSGSLSSSFASQRRQQRVGDVHPVYVKPDRPAAAESQAGSGGGSGSGAGSRSVPVLYATPHGLRITSSPAPSRLADSTAERHIKYAGTEEESNNDARKCDVFGSVAALQSEDLLTTSDYDSGEEDGGGLDAGCRPDRSADGGGLDAGRRPDRSAESRHHPPSTSANAFTKDSTSSKTAQQPQSEKAKCASRGIGDQPAGRATWYDDNPAESPAETRGLTDSGVGTLKSGVVATVDGPSGMTEVSPRVVGEDHVERVTPSTATEPVQTKGTTKTKTKKTKNEEGRSSRRVGDAQMSEHGNERAQKSTKATSKTAAAGESQSRPAQPSSTSNSTSAQPQRRTLPKIAINGRVQDEEWNAHAEHIGRTTSASGSRRVVHSNTDPAIATVTRDVRSKMAAEANGDEDAAQNDNKEAGVGRPRTAGRPLPPIDKRRRTSSESSAVVVPSDASR